MSNGLEVLQDAVEETYSCHLNSIKYWRKDNNVIVGCHASIQTVFSDGERWSFEANDTDWLGPDLKYCNVVLDISTKFGTVVEEPTEKSVSLFINKKITFIEKVPDLQTKAPFLEAAITQNVTGHSAFKTRACLKVKNQKDGGCYWRNNNRAVFFLSAAPSSIEPTTLPSKEKAEKLALNVLSAEDFITKFFL